MSPVRFLSALLVVLSPCAFWEAGAQTPSGLDLIGKQPAAESATLATGDGNRAISFDVVAVDKTGAPVAGLTTGDFTVLDNRQPRSIASLRAAGIGGVRNEPPVEIVLAIDAINIGKEKLTEEFDWLHAYLNSKGRQLDLPISFAILEDQTIKMQNHPTRDAAALARYLDSNRPGFRALRTWSNGWGAVEREEISLKALNSLAAQAEKRPGRKLLIWIGPGWGNSSDPNARPIGKGEQTLFNSIVAVWDRLRNARMTLDMIDPTISGGRIFDFNFEPFLKAASEARKAEYGHLMLPALAAQSGGQVLYGSNDLPALIDRCVADANSYYIVTYNPPQASHPSEYHAVEIKIDRPGVAARTRAGYYAQP